LWSKEADRQTVIKRPAQIKGEKKFFMVPFIVLIALFGIFSLLGKIFLATQFHWLTSLRLALAGMFLLTASAHWGKRRSDLIAMVPPAFPRPDLLVTATGVLEIVGAVGLMVPRTAPYAALGLCLMLLAVFPANVHAARQHLSIAGRPVEALLPRALLQLVFLAATATVFAVGKR
jgi:uncharacterized membrane protein